MWYAQPTNWPVSSSDILREPSRAFLDSDLSAGLTFPLLALRAASDDGYDLYLVPAMCMNAPLTCHPEGRPGTELSLVTAQDVVFGYSASHGELSRN